ncbi:MAG: hypothetical protein LBN95_13730 [Prevotellaceae bacterium]|jgi:hypothetical protein|nr:hypothetical protein [Prevotellaceae bacterium]
MKIKELKKNDIFLFFDKENYLSELYQIKDVYVEKNYNEVKALICLNLENDKIILFAGGILKNDVELLIKKF